MIFFRQAGAAVSFLATKPCTLLWPLLAMVLIEGGRLRLRGLEWRNHVRAIPLGVVSGLVIAWATLGLHELTELGDYVRRHGGAIRGKVEQLGIGGYYVAVAVGISTVHSLLEEYYWRWFVFGRLRWVMPTAAAAALASFAFTWHHYVILSRYFPVGGVVFFGTFVAAGGAFWCWLYQRQRSLVGAWLSHLLVDAVIFYIGYKILLE